MKIIGLAGGSGSGKGAVSQIFTSLGFDVIDTDALYHSMTSTKSDCLDELVGEFGTEILLPDNSLDRKKLASLVFSDSALDKREKLNSIAHRHVLTKVREIIAQLKYAGKALVVVDAPLLFESGFDKECDIILSVLAPIEIRIERIIKRDAITKEAAEKRISAQLTDDYLIGHSDFCIVNNGTKEQLSQKVREIAEKILNS